MALPALNDQPRTEPGPSLRDRIRNAPPAANDSSNQARRSNVIQLNRPKAEPPVKRTTLEQDNQSAANVERIRNEREQAQEKATRKVNPLVPLLEQMNNQLSGIQKTLVEMNKTIQSVGKNIIDTIKALDLGVGGRG